MFFFIIVSVISLTTPQAASVPEPPEEQWVSFKLTYARYYENEIEEQLRKEIFMKKLQTINEHNKKYEAGQVTFKLGVNEFADKTHNEFVQSLKEFRRDKSLVDVQSGVEFNPITNEKLPASIDWREKEAVTPVKNQMLMAPSWSFSATGALEAQFFLKSGKLVTLSEQNLIDCCQKEYDHAFQCVINNGGISSEEDYPLGSCNGKCCYKPELSAGTIRNYTKIQSGNEYHLKVALATVGPVSVNIDVSMPGFGSYKEGIYNDPLCSSTNINHAALVVGYGTSEAGADYWIVKNSWGKSYGKNGYILMSRNKNNQCGIASAASYPTV